MTKKDTATTPAAGSPESAGLSRRTVVRTAANSAWAVPAVMAATSAPAFAASSGLKVTNFTAAYAQQGAAFLRADILTFSATMTATGATTTGLTFTISIPKGTARFAGSGNLYDTVYFVANPASPYATGDPTGWTSVIAATPGDPTYSHKVTFTRTGDQIAPGTPLVFNWALKFTPALGATQPFTVVGTPYKPFVGAAYNVLGQANATNTGGLGFATAAVAEASSGAPSNTTSLLEINNFVAARNAPGGSTAAVLTVSAIGTDSGTDFTHNMGAVTNSGRKTCGPITVRIRFNNIASHRYFTGTPAANASVPTGWAGGARSGTGTVADPWTYTFTVASPLVASPPAAYAPSSVSGNTATLGNTPDFGSTTITLANAGSGGTATQNVIFQATSTTDASFTAQITDPA